MTTKQEEEKETLYDQYKLEEYKRLCSEIERQLDRRDALENRVMQIAGICATGAGLILTLGGLGKNLLLQELGAAIVLLACPITLGFVACQREQIDLRIAQINFHLRQQHEDRYLAGEGWETMRHRLFKARPWFLPLRRQFWPTDPRASATYHELAPLQGLNVIGSRGLFCTIEALFILAGGGCAWMALQTAAPLPGMLFTGLLFFGSLGSLILSWMVIEHKRQREIPAQE